MILRGGIQRLASPFQTNDPDLSGQYVQAAPVGTSFTTTNTSTLVTNTIYGMICPIYARNSIQSLVFRTSSSNASVGAAVKMGVYRLNKDLTVGALVGQTGAIAITDSATSTAFEGAITGGNVTLEVGLHLFCVLPTTTTTAVRTVVATNNAGWSAFIGAKTLAQVTSGSVLCGYTATGVYADGFPATFPATTDVTSFANLPLTHYRIA